MEKPGRFSDGNSTLKSQKNKRSKVYSEKLKGIDVQLFEKDSDFCYKTKEDEENEIEYRIIEFLDKEAFKIFMGSKEYHQLEINIKESNSVILLESIN